LPKPSTALGIRSISMRSCNLRLTCPRPTLYLPTLNLRLSNRWCVLPMEGWDGTRDGKPSDLTMPLAALRAERGKTHLGWRSGSRSPRRAR
jgi:hypothetical protein